MWCRADFYCFLGLFLFGRIGSWEVRGIYGARGHQEFAWCCISRFDVVRVVSGPGQSPVAHAGANWPLRSGPFFVIVL